MPTRAVQISIDEALLHEIDTHPETRAMGRSAFVRRAVLAYLRSQKREDIARALRAAYSGKSEALGREITDLIEDQSWPDE